MATRLMTMLGLAIATLPYDDRDLGLPRQLGGEPDVCGTCAHRVRAVQPVAAFVAGLMRDATFAAARVHTIMQHLAPRETTP